MMQANHKATLRSAAMVAPDAKQTKSKAANQDNGKAGSKNPVEEVQAGVRPIQMCM
jgi:hypothetical protein